MRFAMFSCLLLTVVVGVVLAALLVCPTDETDIVGPKWAPDFPHEQHAKTFADSRRELEITTSQADTPPLSQGLSVERTD